MKQSTSDITCPITSALHTGLPTHHHCVTLSYYGWSTLELKHFLLFQLMHTILKSQECYKTIKIPTIAPTCFGSIRNHHQGVISCLVKTTIMVLLCSSLITWSMSWWHISLLCERAVPHVCTTGSDGFGGLVVSMLASGTQGRGFKPGRSRWIFTHAFRWRGSKRNCPMSQL
jgi:hypothetical protein